MTDAHVTARPALPSVADFLSREIDRCGKSQVDIAREVGFDKPNMITMLKQGKSKLPIARVPAMAKSLGVDPRRLLRLAVLEYDAELWDVIESIMGQPALTENETEIIKVIRSSRRVFDPKIQTSEERAALLALIEVIAAGRA